MSTDWDLPIRFDCHECGGDFPRRELGRIDGVAYTVCAFCDSIDEAFAELEEPANLVVTVLREPPLAWWLWAAPGTGQHGMWMPHRDRVALGHFDGRGT